MESNRPDLETKVAEGPTSELPLGTSLERRFLLTEVLGRGGMGVVYKALDKIAEDLRARQPYVALKVLIPELATDERFKRLLFDEVEKARSLAHPNIISVREYFEDGTNVFLTMEYLEGKTLDQVLEQYPQGMSFSQGWRIVEAMGEALAFAHKNGIVHSDIKPSNVFVTDEDSSHSSKVKVVDFGISKRASLAVRGVDVIPTAVTTILGGMRAYTPMYASPEQLDGGDPVFTDDVYALACTIYQIFTGHHPFKNVPANTAKLAGMKASKPDSLGRRQWRTLAKGLSFSAQERIQTVEALIQGLRPGGGDDHSNVPRFAIGGGLVAAAALGWYIYGDGHFGRLGGGAPTPPPVVECDPAEPYCSPIDEPTASVAPTAAPILSATATSEPSPKPTPLATQAPAPSVAPTPRPTPIATPSISRPGAPTFSRLDDDAIFRLGRLRAVSERGDLAIGVDEYRFRIGESFKMRFASAEFLYVYILVIDPNNRIDQIYPNEFQPDSPVAPERSYEVPAPEAEVRIGEPVGLHRLILVASKSPIPGILSGFKNAPKDYVDSEQVSIAELSVEVVK